MQTPYTTIGSNIQGFRPAGPSDLPTVAQNQTNSPLTLSIGGSQLTFVPRAVVLHPGRSGECAVLRFTAPKPGHYRISARFYAMDGYGCGTNVKAFVLHNRVGSPGSMVRANGGPQYHSFNFGMPGVSAGATIDFAVDMNGSVSFDSTGLHALIEWQ